MMSVKRSLVYGAVAAAVSFGSVAMAGDSHDNAPHWGYSGDNAPDNWGNLATEFKTCSAGTQQSPINITGAASSALDDIAVNYSHAPLEVVNNGHTVQVNFPEGNTMTVGGTTYKLLQYHFHASSEHTIDGKSYPLEAHLVHKTDDGKLGVIGVMLEQGAENPAIAEVFSNLPKAPGKIAKDDVKVNPATLLPEQLSYYNYSGSLTTPPCSEGVNWMVLTTPVEASAEQISAFTSIFAENNRPVQALNERVVSVDE